MKLAVLALCMEIANSMGSANHNNRSLRLKPLMEHKITNLFVQHQLDVTQKTRGSVMTGTILAE